MDSRRGTFGPYGLLKKGSMEMDRIIGPWVPMGWQKRPALVEMDWILGLRARIRGLQKDVGET